MGETPRDPVTAHLDEVRKRAARTKPSAHGYTPRGEQLPGGPADDWLIANLEAAADVPGLLAAVEGVLKLAGEWDRLSVGEPAVAAARLRLRAAELRGRVSRTLLGEGKTDGR